MGKKGKEETHAPLLQGQGATSWTIEHTEAFNPSKGAAETAPKVLRRPHSCGRIGSV
jgi:hypothetical protein